MNIATRAVLGTIAGAVGVVVVATPVLADECTNASKKGEAGAQVIFGEDENGEETVVYISNGLQQRVDRGIVDFDTGEGFHGLIGFDIGDGTVVSTWIGVGPDGHAIPETAQSNGPACRGLTNIGTYFEECLGG